MENNNTDTQPSKRTSADIANMFLNGRTSAWLSVKQTEWILNTISRERGDNVRHRSYSFFDGVGSDVHGYELNVAPNRAAILKPIPCMGRDCRMCGSRQ